jgi:hypothetical protein
VNPGIPGKKTKKILEQYIHVHMILVGGRASHPSEKSWTSSVGMMTFPIYEGK